MDDIHGARSLFRRKGISRLFCLNTSIRKNLVIGGLILIPEFPEAELMENLSTKRLEGQMIIFIPIGRNSVRSNKIRKQGSASFIQVGVDLVHASRI